MGCHQDRSDQLRLTESFPWVPVSPPEATTENMRLNSPKLHGNSTSLLETFGFPVFQIQGVRPFSGEVLGMSRSSGNALFPKLHLQFLFRECSGGGGGSVGSQWEEEQEEGEEVDKPCCRGWFRCRPLSG